VALEGHKCGPGLGVRRVGIDDDAAAVDRDVYVRVSEPPRYSTSRPVDRQLEMVHLGADVLGHF